jgi:hypothetical protein
VRARVLQCIGGEPHTSRGISAPNGTAGTVGTKFHKHRVYPAGVGATAARTVRSRHLVVQVKDWALEDIRVTWGAVSRVRSRATPLHQYFRGLLF